VPALAGNATAIEDGVKAMEWLEAMRLELAI
jgi:hypothetical protein